VSCGAIALAVSLWREYARREAELAARTESTPSQPATARTPE
jgi:hypothetical protein